MPTLPQPSERPKTSLEQTHLIVLERETDLSGATAEKPFVSPALFRDRNFAVALVCIFVVGIVLLATLALLTPFLQNAMGYPVVTAGLVMGPRGIGTMLAMMMGRLVGRFDPRGFITIGFILTARALYDMTGFTADVSERTIVVSSLLVSKRQANHAEIATHVTPFNRLFQDPDIMRFWNPLTAVGRAALDDEITRQATVIAFIDDFKLMMITALLAIPLVFFLRRGRSTSAPPAVAD